MNIQYVSGSRADYGLMQLTLLAIHEAEALDLGLVLTGQATNSAYGAVEAEAEAVGMTIAHKIPADLTGAGRAQMARAYAAECAGFANIWATSTPDLILLLGDRGEMLAAATIAFHLGIPTAHLHGGERSGTLDEGFRHAISKLATYHFAATQDAADRLVAMGEFADRIFVVGAPGLVGLDETEPFSRNEILQDFGLPVEPPLALMLFHPVVEESELAYRQTATTIQSLDAAGMPAVIFRPNSDAGGEAVDRAIADVARSVNFKVEQHLSRETYLRLLASADLLIGNSSSGIIESASVQTPCINLGSRQDGRLRNTNTVDCPQIEKDAIAQAILRCKNLQRPFENLYGDGKSDQRIVQAIRQLDLSPGVTAKRLRY